MKEIFIGVGIFVGVSFLFLLMMMLYACLVIGSRADKESQRRIK